MSSVTRFCEACGSMVMAADIQDHACPACRSTALGALVSLDTASIAVSGNSLLIVCKDKAKPAGSKRGPRFKQKLVVERHVASGRLRHNEHVIDKAEDLKIHRAWDFETGELVHETIEPLSQAVDRGSAKRRAGE